MHYLCRQKNKSKVCSVVKFAISAAIGCLIAYVMSVIYPTSKDGEINTSITERFNNWKQLLNADKRVLVFDIILWLAISICYTLWVFEVISCRQAFLSGLTAEGMICSYLSNIRHRNK